MLWKHVTKKVLKYLNPSVTGSGENPAFWLFLSEITLQMPGPTINILVVRAFPLTNLFLEVPAPTPSSDPGLHPTHDFTAGVCEALGLTAGYVHLSFGSGGEGNVELHFQMMLGNCFCSDSVTWSTRVMG